jgi:hypothetical protein
VALWPLNETGDPSLGTVAAFDVIGGFNGTYAANADTGSGNSAAIAAGYYTGPVAGPAAGGLTGFPGGGALGSAQNVSNTYVSTLASPLFPGLNSSVATALANSTNVTIVAWCNPNVYP